MKEKVILISIDGCRPDGIEKCGNPFVEELKEKCLYSYTGASVFPSVTFPCHFTMAHSVTPERHGLLTNTYVPEVRPVMGIFEKVALAGGVCCMFYGWENIRDIARPGAMKFSTFINCYTNESTDTVLTDDALFKIEKYDPDLSFLYLVDTDDKGGHDSGWMSGEYLKRVSVAVDCVKRIFDKFGGTHSIIIMADHGGHDRSHGTNSPEDMTVPFFYYGKRFTPGKIDGGSLLDIAPTIADLLGVTNESEWEGKSFAN